MAIYKFRENQALLEFDYTFAPGVIPGQEVELAHFDKLFEFNPDLEWFEVELAQGRWHEQVSKRLNGFSNDQFLEGSGWRS